MAFYDLVVHTIVQYCTACVELLNGVKYVSRRLQQVVVLLQDKVVYLVRIYHLVVQLVPKCHLCGSTKTTGGPYETNKWSV